MVNRLLEDDEDISLILPRKGQLYHIQANSSYMLNRTYH